MNRVAIAGAALGIVLTAAAGCRPIVETRMRTRVDTSAAISRETVLTRRAPKSGDAQDEKRAPLAAFFPDRFGQDFPQRTVERDSITLSGTFRDPAAMPADFARVVPVVDGTSRNRVSLRRQDILFGTHFLYRERFVDAIEPEDLSAARDALVDQCVRFARAAARHEFGRDWNLDAFDAWAKKDLAELLKDLLEIWYAEQRNFGRKDPHTGKTGLDRAFERAKNRLARAGLSLDGDDPGTDLNRLLIEGWIADLLALKLTKKQGGAAASVEDFRYLFPEPPAAEAWSGLARVTARTAELEYGTTEAAEESFRKSLLAVTGTYGSAEHEYRFDCAVEMPGRLLRTNGHVEGENSAFWLFSGDDLFPRGVDLEVESVVLDLSLLARIRELRSALDVRDAVWIIRELEDVDAAERAAMRAALEECARFGSLKWFDDASSADYPNRDSLRSRLEPILEPLRAR